MNTRSLPLLIFPILGILCAWIFRPSEIAWDTLQKPKTVSLEKRNLPFPDGQALRFIEVPGRNFFLSETEVPERILSLYALKTFSHKEAIAFTKWVSERTGENIRLPMADEWRTAARAGRSNTEFPWGFGPPTPPEGIHFDLNKAPSKPGPPFGYGFRDMGGGLWEWTREGFLLGSAWSERNPQTLYIDYTLEPAENYAGKDTGIRLLWEIEEQEMRE